METSEAARPARLAHKPVRGAEELHEAARVHLAVAHEELARPRPPPPAARRPEVAVQILGAGHGAA